MNCCCEGGAAAQAQSARTWPGRIGGFFRWALPITALALVPKCPACVAAYVLLFTGIGLSIPVAAAMRWALIVSCVAAIIFLLTRRAVGVLKQIRA
jgi:hypothetical protein